MSTPHARARRSPRAGLGSLALVGLLVACNSFDEGLLEGARPRGEDAAVGAADSGARDAGGQGSDAGGRRDAGIDAATPTGGTGGAPPVDDDGGIEDAGANLDGAAPTDATPVDAGGPDAGCGPTGMDCCPGDPDKTAPGVCGCGVPDDDTDSDSTPDCLDGCPADPNKTARGACGCGATEAAAAECRALSNALRHRYSFGGSGMVAVDSISGADGTVVNTSLDGSGALTLAGDTSDEYVELPDGIVSALTDATIEVWLTWQGGGGWQRIFDFGSSTGGDGNQGNGDTYLFMTPQTGGSPNALRAALSLSGPSSETRVTAASALATGGMHHVALVVADQSQLRLYVDGALEGMAALAVPLSMLTDVNNWLGRSQYQTDPELAGTLDEVRIYDAALGDAELAASFTAGPDPAFLAP